VIPGADAAVVGTGTVVAGTRTVEAGTGTVGAGTGTVGAGTGAVVDTAIEAVVRGVDSAEGSEPTPPRARLSARAVPARPTLAKTVSANAQPNQRRCMPVFFTATPLVSARAVPGRRVFYGCFSA
jgi:hypothetical protein